MKMKRGEEREREKVKVPAGNTTFASGISTLDRPFQLPISTVPPACTYLIALQELLNGVVHLLYGEPHRF
jgi:hypothetical protein